MAARGEGRGLSSTAGAAQAAEGAGEDLARREERRRDPSGCDRIPEGGSGQNHKCIRDAGFETAAQVMDSGERACDSVL